MDQSGASVWNYELLSQHTIGGFGGIGEGIGLQLTSDGRRILWLAHESAPKNFSAVDVTDPRLPKLVVQTNLPHSNVRSNSLDVVGNLMAVAYQTTRCGLQPAGFELFDISQPENPRSIGFFDASGPHSRGVHQLWFADGEFVHLSGGAPDVVPLNENDDQFYRIVDVRNPSAPREVGRWWFPGTLKGDSEQPPTRIRAPFGTGFRAHNTNVYPQRPDRAYVGFLDGGFVVLDISDKARPKVVTHWNHSPPFNGFTHTVLPLFERQLLVVTDESVMDAAEDWPKLVWVFDNRRESGPIPLSTCPSPPVDAYAKRGGRFGAHNLHENFPSPLAWKSEDVIVGTFFNGGLRAYDVSDPFRPKEIASFVPPAPERSIAGSIQLNDVFVDERGITYTVDRHSGGVYILAADF